MSTLRTTTLGLALLGLALLAAPARALYLFYMRKDLALALEKDPASVVEKQVVVTDELIVVWPEAQERPADKDGKQWVLFDTTLFHCAIPRDSMGEHLDACWQDANKGYGEALKKLHEINEEWKARKINETEAQTKRTELYWELYRVWANKPLVTVFGTVSRADYWGPVIAGKEEGVGTERFTIVADKVERPRRRWYEEGLDEGMDVEPPSMRELLDQR